VIKSGNAKIGMVIWS